MFSVNSRSFEGLDDGSERKREEPMSVAELERAGFVQEPISVVDLESAFPGVRLDGVFTDDRMRESGRALEMALAAAELDGIPLGFFADED
jgi:hypothetical protein